jgi:hypothetical protein
VIHWRPSLIRWHPSFGGDSKGEPNGEKEGILGLNRPFLGLKRGKNGGLQLLIRQQGKNASC